MMGTLLQDIRYGIRMLRKSPGFTAIAVISLALGIGANTAVFSLFNSVLLRPLPVRNPHELCGINWVGDFCPGHIRGRVTGAPNGEQISNTFTYPAYCEFRDRGVGVAEVFAFLEFNEFNPPTALIGGQASRVDGMMVSGNFFRGLGLEPILGRLITPEHDKPDVVPVTVISYHAWQQYFSGDTNVIGQTIVLNQMSAAVIGVLPKGFLGIEKGRRRDFYIPLSLQPQIEGICALESANHWWVQVMARLEPSVDELQVSRSLGTLFARTTGETVSNASQKNLRIILTDGRSGLGGALAPRRHSMAKPLFLLFGLVGVVLLVTCINLAGLLLARGAMRRHEFAVRVALGAGRRRLIQQLLTESTVLSVIGASCGFLLASWIKPVLSRGLWSSDTALNLQSDTHVFGFMLTILAVTTILFGLLPALRMARTDSVTNLKNRTMLGASRLRLSKMLISIQVGLSLLLLVGAGLFTRTLINIRRIETGFNTENMLVFRTDAGERQANFCAAVGALPGVQAVTYSNLPLLTGIRSNTELPMPGDRSGRLAILVLNVGETFLQTMGIPLLAGRDFQVIDTEESQRVIIVNQSLVRSAFPDDNPIGKTLTFHQKDYRIVGVCGDTKYYDLKTAFEPTVFVPSRRGTCYAVRTVVSPQNLVPAVRKTLATTNPGVALSDVKTLRTRIAENTIQERSFTWLASSLAFLAVLLSCIGLFGLISYLTTQRTSEIGIRLALGARPLDVGWSVLRNALCLVLIGTAIGVPLVLVTSRLIRSYLFGIEPYDPVSLAGATILLIIISVAAVWLPARRAAKIDPMEALRYE